jgi:hypothetical protein
LNKCTSPTTNAQKKSSINAPTLMMLLSYAIKSLDAPTNVAHV